MHKYVPILAVMLILNGCFNNSALNETFRNLRNGLIDPRPLFLILDSQAHEVDLGYNEFASEEIPKTPYGIIASIFLEWEDTDAAKHFLIKALKEDGKDINALETKVELVFQKSLDDLDFLKDPEIYERVGVNAQELIKVARLSDSEGVDYLSKKISMDKKAIEMGLSSHYLLLFSRRYEEKLAEKSILTKMEQLAEFYVSSASENSEDLMRGGMIDFAESAATLASTYRRNGLVIEADRWASISFYLIQQILRENPNHQHLKLVVLPKVAKEFDLKIQEKGTVKNLGGSLK